MVQIDESRGDAMKMFSFTNPVPGREAEYIEWYNVQHIPDLLAVPGCVSAERLRFVPNGPDDERPLPQYVSVYEIEGDYEAFRAELAARVADGRIPISDALDTSGGTIIAGYGPID